MAQLNVNLNATLVIDDDVWYETLEAYDGIEEDAVQDLINGLEGSPLYASYGEAWVCWAEDGGWIHRPGKDERPL